ncbi:MAG: type II secretion system secretin GspD [Bryobacterales bacterium]|nr:type II secretion system secretin GspD [Bryobacterales bacterium]MBV9397158.1 type II secretion system secretin GspD [Bryobacterales bacterium]
MSKEAVSFKRSAAGISCVVLFALTGAYGQAPAPQQPQPAPGPQQPPPAPVPIGNLAIANGSLREVVTQLAQALKINIILDPKVTGNVTINTYGELRNLDARNLLELILRINGFGMAQEGDVYRILPMKDVLKQPIPFSRASGKDIPEDDQTILNLIFLKYVTVDELSKVIDPFTGDNAVMLPYPPANLLFILDSRRNMKRIMGLIDIFDSDTFANQRVRLFELKNARPSDMQKDLQNVLQSISMDAKTSPVRFLAVDRINTLIAVAPNPGVFDTVAQWIEKLDVPVTIAAGAVDNYVYRVRYGRAECLAIALTSLFGGTSPAPSYASGYNPYGAYAAPSTFGNGYGGGGFGPYGVTAPIGGGGGFGGFGGFGGYGGFGGNTWGSPNAFTSGFGGSGACGAAFGGGVGGSYGVPAFGGFSAQTPATSAAAPATGSGASGAPAAVGPAGVPVQQLPPRIVANPLDNSLIIQADAQRYQSILKLLKDLDIPPRQILLEAKIYSIDLTDQFAYGLNTAYTRRNGQDTTPLANITNGVASLSVGALTGNAKQLMFFLQASENIGHVHILSEPSLIATDSIPASINVGTQVPVSTGTTTLPSAGGVAVTQSISGVSTGITLQVNARVTPSGVVTLLINQEVSNPQQSSGTTNPLTPSFSQQVVQTQITTQDGDTIAIGGVIGETVNSSTTGLPFVSRIPIIGGLLGQKTYSHERTELILFMTPHVIHDQTDLIEASDELVGRVKKLKKYINW